MTTLNHAAGGALIYYGLSRIVTSDPTVGIVAASYGAVEGSIADWLPWLLYVLRIERFRWLGSYHDFHHNAAGKPLFSFVRWLPAMALHVRILDPLVHDDDGINWFAWIWCEFWLWVVFVCIAGIIFS